jgi:hypothetical protein
MTVWLVPGTMRRNKNGAGCYMFPKIIMIVLKTKIMMLVCFAEMGKKDKNLSHVTSVPPLIIVPV